VPANLELSTGGIDSTVAEGRDRQNRKQDKTLKPPRWARWTA